MTEPIRCRSLIYTGPRRWERCGYPVKWSSPDGPVCGYHRRMWLADVVRPLEPEARTRS